MRKAVGQAFSGYVGSYPVKEEPLRFILHPSDCSTHQIDIPHWVEVDTGTPFTAWHKNLFGIVNQRRRAWTSA